MRYLSCYRSLFWRLPWSAPLRSALDWQPDPDQFLPDDDPPAVPKWLRYLPGMEIGRLLRLVQTPASEPGEGAGLAAVLAASEHIAQVYHHLRRRCKAQAARGRSCARSYRRFWTGAA